MKVGAPVTDITAGILGALGVVSALFERERTGRGALVDTSLYEAGVTHTYWQSAIALAGAGSPGPMGSAHPLSAPYQAFRTADGWINVGASNEATWGRLIDALGRHDLAKDPRFATNGDRMAHLDELVEILGRELEVGTSADWLRAFEAAGVREMVVEVQHPRAGRVRSLGHPVKLWPAEAEVAAGAEEAVAEEATEGGETPESEAPLRGAPLLGEHTREVLLEAGWSEGEVEALAEEGVVWTMEEG